MNENQKKHARKKLFLKIFGCIFSAAGIVLAVIGFADFFGAAAEADMPDKFWCVFAGFPLLFIGIAMLLFGFRKEIARYVKDESAPVLLQAASSIIKETARQEIPIMWRFFTIRITTPFLWFEHVI